MSLSDHQVYEVPDQVHITTSKNTVDKFSGYLYNCNLVEASPASYVEVTS